MLLITLCGGALAADCLGPDGVAGEIIFNADHKIMQFCDGEDWQAMNGKGGGGGSINAPAGAIIAFDLTDCPNGWSPYTAAQGRFLRGIDPSGTVDPDGVRTAGDLQEDAFKQHSHNVQYWNGVGSGRYTTIPNTMSANGNTAAISSNTVHATGGDETRPKNVAVLYCRKD